MAEPAMAIIEKSLLLSHGNSAATARKRCEIGLT
jgi:hypothetical protein